MPSYFITGTVENPPRGLYVGDLFFAIVATDSIATGFKSQAVGLCSRGNSAPPTLRMQVDFNGDPGTFEVDLQESDLDIDADYRTVATITATSGAPNFSCYIQYVNPTGQLYRIYAKTMGNTIASGAVGTLCT